MTTPRQTIRERATQRATQRTTERAGRRGVSAGHAASTAAAGSPRGVAVVAGRGAALLAAGSAAVSGYWALGGNAGLRSVGGSIEKLARQHTAITSVGIWLTVAAKLVAVLLALALVRGPRLTAAARSWVWRLNALAAVLLVAYGGVMVASAAAVEVGLVHPGSSVDWYALRWHLGLWDLWFLVWGLLLGIAVVASRRRVSPGGPDVASAAT
jgi:hypothetical protein